MHGRCFEAETIRSFGQDSASLRVLHDSERDTPAPQRVNRSMRADGVHSANAGADEEESKPPAFQIIILVREDEFLKNNSLTKCLGTLPAIFL